MWNVVSVSLQVSLLAGKSCLEEMEEAILRPSPSTSRRCSCE